jgi:hypothetical protein
MNPAGTAGSGHDYRYTLALGIQSRIHNSPGEGHDIGTRLLLVRHGGLYSAACGYGVRRTRQMGRRDIRFVPWLYILEVQGPGPDGLLVCTVTLGQCQLTLSLKQIVSRGRIDFRRDRRHKYHMAGPPPVPLATLSRLLFLYSIHPPKMKVRADIITAFSALSTRTITYSHKDTHFVASHRFRFSPITPTGSFPLRVRNGIGNSSSSSSTVGNKPSRSFSTDSRPGPPSPPPRIPLVLGPMLSAWCPRSDPDSYSSSSSSNARACACASAAAISALIVATTRGSNAVSLVGDSELEPSPSDNCGCSSACTARTDSAKFAPGAEGSIFCFLGLKLYLLQRLINLSVNQKRRTAHTCSDPAPR